jgi:hypothetical protein
MKTLVVFDSEHLENIGCRLTSRGVKRFVSLSSSEVISVTAQTIFTIGKSLQRSLCYKLLSRSPGSLAVWWRWRLVQKRVALEFTELFAKSDRIVINGEGAIHHANTTGLILLACIELAKKLDKNVSLINVTLEALPSCVVSSLTACNGIVTRESTTSHYLKTIAPRAKVITGYDFAWYELCSSYREYLLAYRGKSARTLYTPGVAGAELPASVDSSLVTFLAVERSDNARIPVPGMSSVSLTAESEVAELFHLLDDHALLVSGRHHINIVGFFFGIPVQPLQSNTWKTAATVRDLLLVEGLGNDDRSRVGPLKSATVHHIQGWFEKLVL